ncbi:DoxX family protein [Litoreibacter roseus]|uniref:DoxX-like protein n=1 Tax=Litoreibacter roseus TaxID=2601869 RepID=A0A6N6JIK8_9RHOB|nr:DoxX family protein [Litoreibacter roseus]GFE66193.1 hypothetical protein KIN_32670 [Litoreibacter roseus]
MTNLATQANRSKRGWATTMHVLLALIFAVAGIAELLGIEALVATFDTLGFGQWLRWVTAVLEILDAGLILLPGSVLLAALLMIGISVGVTISQLHFIGNSPVPPLVLMILSCTAAWLSRLSDEPRS